MRRDSALLLGFLVFTASAPGQVLIEGELHAPDHGAPDGSIALSKILAVASLPGPESEALSFRTWEAQPAGWFRLSGLEGRYTLAFTNPAHFMRPRILTNQFLRSGESLHLELMGTLDYACFHEKSWDEKPARRYWQPFFARGTSVTAIGFKLASDGVDGGGPLGQDVLVSVHRRTSASPPDWPQLGPTATVIGVDCGGPKSYWYSAGFQSGEVPTEPGEAYAISIRPARAGGVFQAFWRPRPGGSPGVFRVGPGTASFEPSDLWMAVSSDGDGLVIPYNKRVHREFVSLTTLERKWSQTWVARGRGLASVVLYAAVSGKQPPLGRQRVRVRVRQGGPDGRIVGAEKIAVGNGNYTGDASWGYFVVVFAPGEVALEPEATYALEFESIETLDTIGGFVNIKGQVSDGRAGFNPYRKCPPDDYPPGTAYRGGSEACDFDLDLQIVEYEHARGRWEEALDGKELLENGSMERPVPGGETAAARPLAWQAFQRGDSTTLLLADSGGESGRFLRVAAASGAHAVDGGWVQRVGRLRPEELYRLSGRLRSTWPASVERKCEVGLDPTGQTGNPDAATIEWTALPGRHGEFIRYLSRPFRPRADAISVWLRARCRKEDPRFPFRADFDDFSLRRVDSGLPAPEERRAREHGSRN